MWLLGPETLTAAPAPTSAPVTQVWERASALLSCLSGIWGSLVWTASFNAFQKDWEKIKPLYVKCKMSQDPLGKPGHVQALLTVPSQWVWGRCHQVCALVQDHQGQPFLPCSGKERGDSWDCSEQGCAISCTLPTQSACHRSALVSLLTPHPCVGPKNVCFPSHGWMGSRASPCLCLKTSVHPAKDISCLCTLNTPNSLYNTFLCTSCVPVAAKFSPATPKSSESGWAVNAPTLGLQHHALPHSFQSWTHREQTWGSVSWCKNQAQTQSDSLSKKH